MSTWEKKLLENILSPQYLYLSSTFTQYSPTHVGFFLSLPALVLKYKVDMSECDRKHGSCHPNKEMANGTCPEHGGVICAHN